VLSGATEEVSEGGVRLPWLQIDADGQTRARLLGRLLGVPETQGIGMALALWTWALEMAPEGDFSGEVQGGMELVAAAVGWPTDDTKRLAAELQRVGLLQLQPAIRVRGLDRYKDTFDKAQAERERWRRANEKRRNAAKLGSDREVTAMSLRGQRAVTATKDGDVDGDNDVARIWPGKPKRERKPSAAEEFFGWLNATRATKKNLPPQPTPARSRINTQIGEAIDQCGRPDLEGRYLAFLGDPVPGAKDPPWPWEVFASTWSWRKPATPKPATKFVTTNEDLYADPGSAHGQ